MPVKGPYVSECSVVLTQLSLLHTHTPTSVGTLPERCVLTSLNMQLDIRDWTHLTCWGRVWSDSITMTNDKMNISKSFWTMRRSAHLLSEEILCITNHCTCCYNFYKSLNQDIFFSQALMTALDLYSPCGWFQPCECTAEKRQTEKAADILTAVISNMYVI